MMFLAHISFSTAIVTLVLGFALFAWSKKETSASSLLKGGGTIVVILSILNMLCIGYYIVRYSLDGYFKAPNVISHDPRRGMMGDMKCMDNMKDMMGGMKGMMDEKMKMMPGDGAKPETSPVSPEDHDRHH